jgi:hypothetical protein
MEEKVFKDILSEILAVDTDEGEIKACLDLQANGFDTENSGLVVEAKDSSRFMLLITKLS